MTEKERRRKEYLGRVKKKRDASRKEYLGSKTKKIRGASRKDHVTGRALRGWATEQFFFGNCMCCGYKFFEVHHIHSVSKGGDNEIENLILLCPNHHYEAHKGIIPVSILLEINKKFRDPTTIENRKKDSLEKFYKAFAHLKF